jgi:hypothetical protein
MQAAHGALKAQHRLLDLGVGAEKHRTQAYIYTEAAGPG